MSDSSGTRWPARGRRCWRGQSAARDAVYRNRRRLRGARGRRLLRRRGERVERPFAHLYRTGRLRRTHVRGHSNIRKRVLIHAAGFNLGLLMRTLVGVGTPRGLQSRVAALIAGLIHVLSSLCTPDNHFDTGSLPRPSSAELPIAGGILLLGPRGVTSATGC